MSEEKPKKAPKPPRLKRLLAPPEGKTKCTAKVRSCTGVDGKSCGFRFHRTGFTQLTECPDCGKPRGTCPNNALEGKNTCRVHGGNAGRRNPFKEPLPLANPLLLQEEFDRLDKYEAEDDYTMKREYHIGRIIFERYLSKATKAEKEGLAGADTYPRLMGMLGILATVANTRDKRAMTAVQSQVNWMDPEVQAQLRAYLKQAQFDSAVDTTRWFLKQFDPDGSKGMRKKLPLHMRRRIEELETGLAVPAEVVEQEMVPA